MTRFDVLATYHKTMSHRGMQASLVAMTTRIYARLHVGIVHVIFSSKVMYEATCTHCNLPEESYRHVLQLRKRYGARKEASVR
jgi:hypothetical protein